MAFESAGKRVGALSLNLIRLVIGLIFLAIYNGIINGSFIPQATHYQWFWLVLSGLVGFVLGDLFLFQSFILDRRQDRHADHGTGPSHDCPDWLDHSG